MSNYYYYRKVPAISIDVAIPEENYYFDEEDSYENFERMLDILQPEDVVYLEEIAVLGNVDDIITRWKQLVEDVRTNVVLCDFPIVDTRKILFKAAICPIEQLFLFNGKFLEKNIYRVVSRTRIVYMGNLRFYRG